jgi:hypothetical protein
MRGCHASTFFACFALTLGIGATGVAGAAESLDDRFAAVAQEAPSFGGMFVDEKTSVLHVYLADPTAPAAARVEEALRHAFAGEGLPRKLQVHRGRFSFRQLRAWHERLSVQVLGLRGVVKTDIDEAKNQLMVGVENRESQRRVARRLAAHGIPRGAVSIEQAAPIKAETSLRDRHRPLVGGLQIASPRSPTLESLCTLGFNAVRAGVQGFVTNSHCTRIQGGVESTVFHQPTTFAAGNRVGVEAVDRPYFTGGACPATRRCRFSDSAFVRRDSGITASQGRIAFNSASGFGSVAWNGTSVHRLVSESDAVAGLVVRKVGRTTGTTRGTVTATCVNANVSGTNITLLCQDEADYSSAGGDSGSPVFSNLNRPQALDASLRGIHWGGGGGVAVFSPIDSGVERSTELGVITACAPGFDC